MRSLVPLAIPVVLGLCAGACSKRGSPGGSAGADAGVAPPDAGAAAAAALSAPRPVVPLKPLATGAVEGSMVALAVLGETTLAYVADDDADEIHTIDVAARRELATTPLPCRPGQLLVAADGTLLVALRDRAAVAVLTASDATAPLAKASTIATATEPIALAATADGQTLLVASAWGHALEAFHLATRERTMSVALAREPRAVTASSDGARAFVAHASAGHVSVVDLRNAAAAVQTTDVGTNAFSVNVVPHEQGEFGFLVEVPARIARQGFALAKVTGKNGERVLVPHTAVATNHATVSGYGGGGDTDVPTEMFDLDVLDAALGTRATTASPSGALSRMGPDACHLPRAAVADDSTKRVFVSCIGNRRIIEYDAAAKEPTEAVERSWPMPAGVLGMALDPPRDQIIAWSQFEHAVVFVPRAPMTAAKTDASPPPPVTMQLAPPGEGSKPALSPLAQEGRLLFHTGADDSIASDGRACASCHPDGRDDSLVWSTALGPRQTFTLAGRVERGPPYGWLGQSNTLQEHMHKTLANLGGKGISDHDFDALAAYLTEMPAPPVHRKPRSATEERGKEVFKGAAGCGDCHRESGGFSDHVAHDIGSATPDDKEPKFLAPSLRFIGGTAPYFHDGRYDTLESLLVQSSGKMGNAGGLSPDDRAALVAYLSTL